jgi:hypothetical protein
MDVGNTKNNDGVIRDVSLISKGPARGHSVMLDANGNVTQKPEEATVAKPMFIDDTTLAQVVQCSPGSLKLRADHGSGVLSTIGYIDNIRANGDKVLGDVHIYESEPERAKIMEIAEKNPEHIALSLEFTGEDELGTDKVFARCNRMIAAALVNEGAANRALFSEKPLGCVTLQSPAPIANENVTKPNMDDYATQLAEYGKRLKACEDALSTAKEGTAPKAIDPSVTPVVQNPDKTALAEDEDKKKKSTIDAEGSESTSAMSSKEELKAFAEQAATEAVKRFAASFGVNLPAAGAHVVADAPKVKTFGELVTEKTKEFGDATKAMLHCIKAHPAEYAASRFIAPKK